MCILDLLDILLYTTVEACRSISSEMSKLKSIYKRFLRSVTKIGFKQINLLDIKNDNPSSNPVDWRYKIVKSFTK